jgi:hypothetical protein
MTDWRSTMPFGKYAGWELEEIPADYLTWLLTIELKPWLREAVADECERRADERERRWEEHERRREERERRTAPPPPVGPVICFPLEEVPLIRRVFDAGFRSLVKKLHPDAGGDVREMQRLNGLAETVHAQLAAIGEVPSR